MGNRAIFLDKDGTLVENVPYNVDPAKIKLTPNAEQGLSLLHDAGFQLIVVTNQSGIARGYFTEADLKPVETRLEEMLDGFGVTFGGFYYCPHHPDGSVRRYAVHCDCRKPRAGLVERAAREHGLDLNECWLIGDILDDVEAAHNAGCHAVLLDNGNETEWVYSPLRLPDYSARDLWEAARVILGAQNGENSVLASCRVDTAFRNGTP